MVHGMFDTTFVYVTHDQLDALALADRVVVMKDGIVQMQDTPDMVYHHPVNEFVDEFFEKKSGKGFNPSRFCLPFAFAWVICPLVWRKFLRNLNSC